MGNGCGVAGILELADEFFVGDDLAGERGTEFEELAQKGGLVYSLKLEKVAREGGHDDGVVNIVAPSLEVAPQ